MKIVKNEYLRGDYNNQTEEVVFHGTIDECLVEAKRIFDSLDANEPSIVSVTSNPSLRDIGVTFVDHDEVLHRNTLVTQSFKIVPENVIWFSRHQPTAAQLAECEQRGWNVVALDQGMWFGARNILDDGDVYAIGQALLGLAADHDAIAIIGVWTAPMQEILARTAQDAVQKGEWCGVECYAAWNVTRPAEGGKPVFEHRRFCAVGRLAAGALRWAK